MELKISEEWMRSIFEKVLDEYEFESGVTLKEAAEKQIAKKPIDDRYPWSICPVCGGSINCEDVQEYIQNKECSHCEHCGQKIDWSV